MKKLIEKLSDEEIEFLKSNKWDNINDMLDLEDILSDYIQLQCLTDDDNLTKNGIICESILNKIGILDDID